jgi:hypothetical protein
MHPLQATSRIAAVLRPPKRGNCTRDTPRCDFWNWGAGGLRPSCCTQHLLELTRFVHELLADNGILHWLDYGTLLGAVREQTFIPWDEDADFGVLEDQVPAILALEPVITASGHTIDASDPTVIRINFSSVNLLHVDLFPWQEVDGVLRTDFNPSLDWPGTHGHTSFAPRYLQDLENVGLYDLQLPAPSPVHQFLADHRYGPDYMVPTRPFVSLGMYPDLGPDQMTSEVKGLLAAIGEKDQHLTELNTRSRYSGTRLGNLWQQAALPPAPPNPPKSSSSGDWTEGRDETLEQLGELLAWFDQAIEEIADPSVGIRMRRARRRLARAVQIVRRTVRRDDSQ